MRATDTVISETADQFGFRVAVLLEPGSRGAAALREAAALAASPESELTVVAIAPTAVTGRCSCVGVSAHAYNCAVQDDVARELDEAIASVAAIAPRIEGKLLVERVDPPLERWVAQRRFDLVLLPSRWGRPQSHRHPAARLLRRQTGATIRVVDRARSH